MDAASDQKQTGADESAIAPIFSSISTLCMRLPSLPPCN